MKLMELKGETGRTTDNNSIDCHIGMAHIPQLARYDY